MELLRRHNLMLGADAAGAQVQVSGLPVNDDGCRVNIRYPAALGVALGMANVITGLW